ncbi:ricin-type beta-trefoil lectin domain protein [Streptacidiphilus sp. 4-A2]|nr:ricin-type beta-trefoil lectin domain protein [Streptacidiphilus sp. 4-A2]
MLAYENGVSVMQNRKFKLALFAAALGCSLSAGVVPASASPQHVRAVRPLSTPQWGTIENWNSGKCLEDHGYESGNGATVDQWTCGSGSNGQWEFVSAGSIYYHIINKYTGLCLEVPGASTTEGAAVDQWTCGSGTNGLWDQEDSIGGGGYMFANAQTDFVLEVAGSSTANGAEVDVYGRNYTDTQFWAAPSWQS